MFAKITNVFRKGNNIRLVDFIYEHCNHSKKGVAYIRFYRRLARLIEEFEASIHKEIMTDSFDDRAVDEYVHFLKMKKPEHSEHNAYLLSTVRNFIQKTICMLNIASRQGYSTNIVSLQEVAIIHEENIRVYLSENEIQKLMELNLTGERAQVRDIFVVGCCIAQRYSDYSNLTRDNFVNGNIEILTKKTKVRVIIPIHHLIYDIIERQNGYEFLTYKKSQQNFNKMLKHICKKAGITDKILVERTEGFKKVKRIFRKYELVSTHTARRSGATNMYLAGIPTFRIMLTTGHMTEAAFFGYIGIRKKENANILQNHPFFKGKC